MAAKSKCECGCNQASHATTRQRLCQCVCGRKCRQTREWLEAGALVCPCGGELLPVCLFDRACLPGEAGQEAYSEFMGGQAEKGLRSEYAKRSMHSRKRCSEQGCGAFRKLGERYCSRHNHADMPF